MLNGAVGPIVATACLMFDEHFKLCFAKERWLHVSHLGWFNDLCVPNGRYLVAHGWEDHRD